MIIKCANCDKEFEIYPWRLKNSKSGNLFCSKDCNIEFRKNQHKSLKLVDNYYVMTIKNKNGTHDVLLDSQDLNKINKYNWHINNHGYVKSNFVGAMHRFIMDCNNNKLHIDHINHNTLDNRRENLRICTVSENQQNSSLRKDNKSGHVGVGKHKGTGKWIARIRCNGENISLGSFDHIQDAINARKCAEVKYFEYKQSIMRTD